jgi:hypothetical protein
MFLWRRRSAADEIAELIQSAIDADRAGRYEAAVDLYTKGIEKLLESLKSEELFRFDIGRLQCLTLIVLQQP